MKLSHIERQHTFLAMLIEGWKKDLQVLREKNDRKSLSAEDTAYLRGQIAQLKENIALADDPPPVIES